MKILKNKILLSLLIIVMIGLSGVASYYTYLSYQRYIAVHNSTKLSSFLENLKSVLKEIENERVQSATYLATQQKDDFNKLKESRVTVDRVLWEFNKFTKQHNDFTPYSKQVEDANKALDFVRKKVDNLNDNYRDIFFIHIMIISLTHFKDAAKVSTAEKSEARKSYLMMYQKYVELKENSVLENTLISFMLQGSKQMSQKDTVLWNQLVVKDALPQFYTLAESSVTVELDALLSTEEFNSIISKEREMILYESRSGKYSVSLLGWSNQMNAKMDYFSQVQSLLHNEIQNIDKETIAQSRNIIIWYAVGTLLLLLGLIKLILQYRKLHTDKHISKDILRDIELILDKNQQHELQRLISNGKVDHIYKFLIKTIKDGNQTKDLFLASMSHEIRTPLNGILGFTQLLKGSENPEEQAEFISVIEKSCQNLLTIVNDILDLSKIKAQKVELEDIEFDPIDSFEAAVESYAARAAEEHIDFNIFLDPELPTLFIGDPTKISQIIMNLVSNAIKFTPKHGEVNVSIKKLIENEEVVNVNFEVSDTGIGLTKEQQGHIFEAFSQADVSTSRKYGGTGLGLSISGKFVTLMGGKLSIHSVKDEGTSFYFTLALKKPKTATKREVPDMSSYSVGILNPHIDTEYDIDENLEAYIAYTGAKIERYTDESLLALKGSSQLPDILFIDHKSRHRENELKPFLDFDTKIIVMSTGDQKKNLKPYTSQIDKILYKPVNFTKILKILTNQEDISETIKKITFENIHVLVAEDNLINQKLILNVFNRLGIEVSLANNGQEALERRMDNEYDMIFMDIQMPVMGGMEATGKIISHERSSHKNHTPIIALTANALDGDRDKYISAGMNGYLSKPLNLEALIDLFQEYFEDRMIQGDEQ